MEKIEKIWFTVIIAILVYLLMGIYVSLEELLDAMKKFDIRFFIFLLFLTSSGYVLRFLKWSYLIKNADVKLSLKQNAFVFFSGLLMTITPAKIGEIWRSFLIREINGEKMSKTIPVVVLDRISDVFSLIFLSFFGFFYYREILPVILFILALSAFLIFSFSSNRTVKILNSITERRFKKYVEEFVEFHQKFSELTKIRIILFSTLLGIFAWFLECLGMYITILGFGGNLDITLSTFIFSFASLAGAVSMIPGGLGVAEFTISGLLHYFGMKNAESVGISIVIRIATLWYGVFLGLVIYFGFRNLFKQ
ncbi:MAG: lysylphosphatidylglycerol synthase transmembrane domain-containing protein [Candidatus Aenigmatarchaeota archaeon]